MLAVLIACLTLLQPPETGPATARSVSIPLDAGRQVSIGVVVKRLSEAGGVDVSPPRSALSLPVSGVPGALTRSLLKDCLGADFGIRVGPDALILDIPDRLETPTGREELRRRLRLLAERAEEAAREKLSYGMRALASYRANDPRRPTICLVHGLNSSSGGFVHMIRPLEEAGYGVVVFDYPFNRPLAESCDRFRADWEDFRKRAKENRPWAIVAHSMGCLVARSLIEGDEDTRLAPEVSSLVMIAPVNRGVHVAKLQSVIQLVSGIRAVKGDEKTRAFAVLSDGIGEAARDLLPGSRFLEELNGRKRPATVPYHILAGDSGFVTREARRQAEGSLREVSRAAGIFGGLARAATGDIPALLEEVSDGTGDGCVSVEETRLDGVADHATIHANHAELIRAPILFADPGPVACMPYVLKWLRADAAADRTLPARKTPRPAQSR